MTEDRTQRPNGFDRFGLHPNILRGIREAGYDSPRPIQNDTLPAAMEGRDVLGLAQTGTGKTAAFALPLLDWIVSEPGTGPSVLVIAPTRELATQITDEFRKLARFTKVKVATVFGGVGIGQQASALRRRPDVVVACPGRLLDLMQQKLIDLSHVGALVLDEADHMFDMGFLPDIKKILAALPKDRQNLLFSATMPPDIRRLANEVLHDPHVVELTHRAPVATVDHALCMVSDRQKRDLLEFLLNADDCDTAIVFTRTKHRAKRLAEQLSRGGHRAVALQGNMSQAQRDRAMSGFRERRFDVLVATDIVARGIDVSGVSHVINFDVPTTPEAYTHRIGRTGRSETSGVAYTFVTSADTAWVKATERMIGDRIARREFVGFEGAARDDERPRTQRPAAMAPVEAPASKPGRRGGRRRSRGGQGQAKSGGNGGRRTSGRREGQRRTA